MEDVNTIFQIVGGGGTGALVWLFIMLRKDFTHLTQSVKDISDRQSAGEEKLHTIIVNFNDKLDNISNAVNRRLYHEDGKLIYQRCDDCEKLMQKQAHDIDELAKLARKASADAKYAKETVAEMRHDMNI